MWNATVNATKNKMKGAGYADQNPKDREVPFGAVTPAPVEQQDLFMTSNWRIVRPVKDDEKCTRCLICYLSCPDACWSYKEEEDKMEWIGSFAKGVRSASMSARRMR